MNGNVIEDYSVIAVMLINVMKRIFCRSGVLLSNSGQLPVTVFCSKVTQFGYMSDGEKNSEFAYNSEVNW